jgi:protein ImuB
MLWLCIHPHRLALDALANTTALGDDGIAVTHRHGNRRWVVASRESEGQKPAFPGVDAAALLAARPDTRLLDRNPVAEQEALQQLAWLAHRWGQPVSLAHESPTLEHPLLHAAVWVEIGRSLKLFGGIDALLADVRATLASPTEGLPLDCRLGVAPTPEAALLAARLGASEALMDEAAMFSWLHKVPVSLLRLSAATRDGLRGAGIRRVEQLLELPLDQLARRFDPATVRTLDRLLGRAPDPRRAVSLPGHFSRHVRFDGDIHSVEGLLFPLRRLMVALSHYLRARDTGALALTLKLAHEDAEASEIELRLSSPARDAGYLMLMLRERLGRSPLAGPVCELTLEAREFGAPEAPQLDLFDTQRTRDDAWRTTLERLVARLGEEAVWNLGLVADHRPEKAWRRLPPDAAMPVSGGRRARRPVWLLDPPRPLPRPPAVRGAPERIEAGWWDGEGAARDYYLADPEGNAEGARLWVYRDRHDGRWFLHGLWA